MKDRASRSKKLLQTVLIVFISLLSLYLLIREIHDFSLIGPDIALFSILIVVIGAYILLRKGYFLGASIITILVTFGGMTFIALTSMGIRDGAVLTYLIIIFFTALLLGKLASLIITFLSIAAIWLMIYFENNGLLVYDPWAIELIARDYTFIFLSAMSLTIFYDNVLNRYITDLKGSRSDYKKINRKLSKRNKRILKINEELRLAKEKAEESDRLKTAFLTNLSHEIRTPMNGIIGFSELLLSPDVNSADKKDYNSIIAKSCKQLLGVVNDIIDISKIESGTVELNQDGFNLNKLLQDQYDLYSLAAKNRKLDLELSFELENNQSFVYSDPQKIRQVVSNLLGNAIKFTNKGSVRFGYTVNGKELMFFVSDTGIGIDPENHEKVFERFIQEHSGTVRTYGGTGLGLSIAKAYIEKLGGRIWLESQLNRGSRFFFTIPYTKVDPPVASSKEPKEKRSNGKMKILIVEDQDSNEQLLIEMLKKYNFEIIVAKTGEQAVNIFQQSEEFGLILMDIKLPGMNGYEATRIIRKQNKLIPIIAQTAHAFSSDRDRALEAGCNEIVTKPIVQKVLDEAIRDALN